VADVATTPPRHQLLGHPIDLAGFLGALGPVPLPAGRNVDWQQALIENLATSGLTGKGGGAFPAAIKVATAHSDGSGGIVVVNGMESDPTSDKDKVLLTRAPHLVLDGAQVLAAVCAAQEIIICIPAERDDIAAAMHRALYERTIRRYDRVSEVLVRPPNGFVGGEESALAHWIEDGNALPIFRFDKSKPLRIGRIPTLVHNAETLAHIALIARHGPEPFLARGTPEEPGTCLVTISGAVTRPGVVEVDRGTLLRDIALRAGPRDTSVAYLVGGYGGTWVGPEHFSVPYAAVPLRAIGASLGVGIIVVLGADGCGLTESARIARFLAEESSGQCGPCVFGLPAIADDLTRLAHGQGDPELMPRLLRRLIQVDGRGACHHPDGAAAMVRSALRVFSTDVDAHLRGAPCPQHRSVTQLRFPRPPAI
jgi:NADH:ubiquinone oxidoreductase subunit F (NADH-binding)